MRSEAMINETKKDAEAVNETHDAVETALRNLLNTISDRDATFEAREDAAATLKEINAAYSFNEYTREHGNPDDALEDMEYLDELAECGGDWGKPTFLLMRAFYGYRFNPWYNDASGREREPFNPNDEYFTFNGSGNLVSVSAYDWGYYWACSLDAAYYVKAAEDEGRLEEIADALGVETGAEDAEIS